MKHLLVCREYPPAPSGGIGTYAINMSRLLAESGGTVHVIGQLWQGAEKAVEEQCQGRLIIHRIPYESWTSFLKGRPNPAIGKGKLRDLFDSGFPAQCFSWQASLLAEKLVVEERIELLEAQDYEAPLYYFQLRRALGMGPRLSPPCFIHLHSPTESIGRHNGWNPGSARVLTARRLEDYSIATADALLCPSRFLASQVQSQYGMVSGRICVAPYPIGDSSPFERDRRTWEEGTICYVGRLEPRKGVLEWIDAAVSAARKYPGARFEFIGSNALGPNRIAGEETLQRLIPRDLEPRFLFHDEQKRSSLDSFLRKARIAVVPSRWENFPYSCIEAMGSGLPVIATREGGMAEMVRDGQSGWLAGEPTSAGLREALGRALGEPWTSLSEMGRQAALDIRRLCDNKKILEAQLQFRQRLADQGASRSLVLPPNLPWSTHGISGQHEKRTAGENLRSGIGIVLDAGSGGRSFERCMGSIKEQTRKPAAVLIVYGRAAALRSRSALRRARQVGWQLLRQVGQGKTVNHAWTETIVAAAPESVGVVYLSPGNRLAPEFLATSEAILCRCPEVGIVSCWTARRRKTWIRPCPSFPYQWLSNDVAPFSAFRVEALRDVLAARRHVRCGEGNWELGTSVMAAGWAAVTVPEGFGEQSSYARRLWLRHFRVRDRINARQREGACISATPGFEDFRSLLRTSPETKWNSIVCEQEWFGNAAYGLRHPVKTTWWLLRQLRGRWTSRRPGIL